MSSNYIYIQDETTWQACLPQLQAATQLAIDLESNSMYAYRESICLIQISTPTQDFIIDPLAEVDIAPLEDVLLNTAVEKIFHAAEYDLILLQNERGWAVNNIFDTMWAARVLGYERIGLANMLNLLFDIQLDKRFQRTDWGRRPLRMGELAYAQGDTHYLFALRDHLAAELHAKGHWEEAQEIFREQSIIPSKDNSFDPEGFWNFAAIKELTPQQRAILKELYLLRDELAVRDGLPVFKVIHNEALVTLAVDMPVNLAELYLVRGISRRQIQRVNVIKLSPLLTTNEHQ
jgi:ribonuclease D